MLTNAIYPDQRLAQCSVEEVLDRMTRLPAAPAILPKLLTALSEPDTDLSRITELITLDQALTAGLLHQCNSALFAGKSPIHEVGEAISRLGFRAVYQLVAGASSSRLLCVTSKEWGLDAEEMWRHSLLTALAAQNLAQDIGEDDSLAFTTGLLHDVGKLPMAEAFKTAFISHFDPLSEKWEDSCEQEQTVFGLVHSEVGARLLQRWNFPEELVMAVRHHHPFPGTSCHTTLTACIILADWVAHMCDASLPLSGGPAQLEALRLLGWPKERQLCYLERVREEFAFFTQCRLNN